MRKAAKCGFRQRTRRYGNVSQNPRRSSPPPSGNHQQRGRGLQSVGIQGRLMAGVPLFRPWGVKPASSERTSVAIAGSALDQPQLSAREAEKPATGRHNGIKWQGRQVGRFGQGTWSTGELAFGAVPECRRENEEPGNPTLRRSMPIAGAI